jgi:hypothetical protein
MSAETEINRIKTARNDIATYIGNMGVAVPSGAKIDDLPPLLNEIGSVVKLETLVVAPMTNAEINANLVAGMFVKVANNYVTFDDLINGATVNGSVIPEGDFYYLFDGVISTQRMHFISVLPVAVGKNLDGVVFNESGTYVLAQTCQTGVQITIPNFHFIRTLEAVERGTTTLTSRKNTSKNTIVFTAENYQKAGYTAGGKSTATKEVSLSVNGSTVTASDGSISISVAVPTVSQDIDTCTIILDVSTFVAFTNNTVRVYYTACGDGLSAEYVDVKASEQPEIHLNYVVCGSAICVKTQVAGYCDAGNVRYNDDLVHFIYAPSTAGTTQYITFTENT